MPSSAVVIGAGPDAHRCRELWASGHGAFFYLLAPNKAVKPTHFASLVHSLPPPLYGFKFQHLLA